MVVIIVMHALAQIMQYIFHTRELSVLSYQPNPAATNRETI
jgi:hypothetical protein